MVSNTGCKRGARLLLQLCERGLLLRNASGAARGVQLPLPLGRARRRVSRLLCRRRLQPPDLAAERGKRQSLSEPGSPGARVPVGGGCESSGCRVPRLLRRRRLQPLHLTARRANTIQPSDSEWFDWRCSFEQGCISCASFTVAASSRLTSLLKDPMHLCILSVGLDPDAA